MPTRTETKSAYLRNIMRNDCNYAFLRIKLLVFVPVARGYFQSLMADYRLISAFAPRSCVREKCWALQRRAGAHKFRRNFLEIIIVAAPYAVSDGVDRNMNLSYINEGTNNISMFVYRVFL